MMEKKTGYCLFFLLLLVPYTVLGAVPKSAPPKPKKEERAAFLVLPAVYYGATVSVAVWDYILLTFAVTAAAAATITVVNSDNHSCRGNSGWCRPTCNPGEFIDHNYSDVCGNYHCCRY
ncbi:big defensin-like [Branchiostoma lanceolatum]|uniref:big defensin-like n=1 Tax=Branchiostoma lanceolatum TaxID=7740 RepID=UPI0034551D2D